MLKVFVDVYITWVCRDKSNIKSVMYKTKHVGSLNVYMIVKVEFCGDTQCVCVCVCVCLCI